MNEETLTQSNPCQDLYDAIQDIDSNLRRSYYLMDGFRTSVVQTSTPNSESFLGIRDELVETTHKILDKMQGYMAELTTVLSGEFTSSLLNAIGAGNNNNLDPEIMNRCSVWLPVSDEHGYLITGHILEDFVKLTSINIDDPSPVNQLTSIDRYFANDEANLNVPAILTNTIGYYNAIQSNSLQRQFVDEMGGLNTIYTMTSERCCGQLHNFMDALNSKEIAFIAAQAHANEQFGKAIETLMSDGRRVFETLHRGLRGMIDFLRLYVMLMPKIAVTANTVNKALAVYKNNSEINF